MDQSYYYDKIYNAAPVDFIDVYQYIPALFKVIESHLVFENHELLHAINNNTINPTQLCKVLTPFYHTIEFWTNHLENYQSLLLDKSDYQTIKLINKIVADSDANLTLVFMNFLNFIGNETCADPQLTRPVKIFRNELQKLLKEKGLAFNACLLGAIEIFCINITETLVDYCNKNNFNIPRSTLKSVDLSTNGKVGRGFCESKTAGPSRLMNNHNEHMVSYFIIARNCDATKDDIVNGMVTGYLLLWNVFHDLLADYKYNCHY